MKRLGPLALVTVVAGTGGVVTLIAARAIGMPADEVVHIAQLLLPAIAATIVATALASPLLRRATVRTRLIAMALISALVALANISVLSALMLVKHDALLISSLIVYSAAAGIGAALAMSRSFHASLDKLMVAASRLRKGDLSTRIGKVDAGPELDRLAATLDEMSAHLEETIATEQKALAMRDDLITAVSHDLRTPLAGLRAMVEAVDDGVVEDAETMRRYASEMRRSIDVLVTLVDDLFELVQLDAGAIRSETERAQVGEVIRSALAACGAQAAEKSVRLETSIEEIEGIFVSPRLTRAMQNLIQNAIRHTPEDGTVRVYGRGDDGVVELMVEDDGDGIAEIQLERVFEPFWRGDASRSQPGAGLGLTLTKRVVEALGGNISVESTLGRGSRFAVVLPSRR